MGPVLVEPLVPDPFCALLDTNRVDVIPKNLSDKAATFPILKLTLDNNPKLVEKSAGYSILVKLANIISLYT